MWRPVRCTERRARAPARLRSAVRTRRRRRSNRESLAILLLLPFLAEDVLAAVLDALALVGLGLAPTADLGGELANGLLVDAADLDRCLVRSFHLQTFRDVELDIVAKAELKLELLALHLCTIADTRDLQDFRKSTGDAVDQVGHQGALHAPMATCRLAVVGRLNQDRAVFDLVADEIRQTQRQSALRPLNAQRTIVDIGSNPAGDRYRLLADPAHQNTSASTSPPTF